VYAVFKAVVRGVGTPGWDVSDIAKDVIMRMAINAMPVTEV
jgi:hypothetical protein